MIRRVFHAGYVACFSGGQAVVYAIIETGGKQYRVNEGQVIQVEKLPVEAGAEVIFDRVLLLAGDGQVKVGSPLVDGARAVARVVEHGRSRKIRVFKYKHKVNYRKRQGHRQPFTRVRIESIQG